MKKKDEIFMPEDHMEEIYSSDNYFVKLVHVNRLDLIVKEIPTKKKMKILDAGCGEGHLIEKLYRKSKENDLYGLDVTKIALEKAKQRCPYAKLKLMDLSDIKFKDGFFDVVVCTEVIEHISDYKKVFQEMRRVLKKDGLFIISFPNEFLLTIGRFFLGRKPVKVVDHINSFTPRRIIRLAKMRKIKQIHIPYRYLPFSLSFVCLLKFKK